ncbi:MAG: hypothetical protein BGO59_09260 [Spirosoma sp. 48-14]|nr:MAG: hypothetical protein BGO59_09260 [Spirosoma sp. 48-14]
MADLRDEDLDKLFKKAVYAFRPSFDSKAWQSMKVRLETQKRTKGIAGQSSRLCTLVAIGAILLFLRSCWFQPKKSAPYWIRKSTTSLPRMENHKYKTRWAFTKESPK